MAYDEEQARKSRVVVETPSERREVVHSQSVRTPDNSGISAGMVGVLVVVAIALITMLVLFWLSSQPATDNANLAAQQPPTVIQQPAPAQQPPVIIQQPAPATTQPAPIIVTPACRRLDSSHREREHGFNSSSGCRQTAARTIRNSQRSESQLRSLMAR